MHCQDLECVMRREGKEGGREKGKGKVNSLTTNKNKRRATVERDTRDPHFWREPHVSSTPASKMES